MTRAGIHFTNFLADQILTHNISKIHVSLSLEALKSNQVPGISKMSILDGLDSKEAYEIFGICGLLKSYVLGVEITDFNPLKESKKTTQFVAALV